MYLLCEWKDYEFDRVWLGMREINDSQFCFYLPWRQSSELKVWMPRYMQLLFSSKQSSAWLRFYGLVGFLGLKAPILLLTSWVVFC